MCSPCPKLRIAVIFVKNKLLSAARFEPGLSRAAGKRATTIGYRPPRPDVRIYTNQAADAKSNANPTTKQHAIVMNIRLNIVSHVSYTYPKKNIRDNAVAPFVLLCIVIVTRHPLAHFSPYRRSVGIANTPPRNVTIYRTTCQNELRTSLTPIVGEQNRPPT